MAECLSAACAEKGTHVRPMMQMRRAQPSESRELREWIVERHYTHAAPPGYIAALEFVNGRRRIGAMLLGRPTARSLDGEKILELTRMFFVDDTPKNTETVALMLMRKWVRTWLPQIKLLLAYADPKEGHRGTIYFADNWCPFGFTRNGTAGWSNRPNRRSEKPSRKQRFVRTP